MEFPSITKTKRTNLYNAIYTRLLIKGQKPKNNRRRLAATADFPARPAPPAAGQRRSALTWRDFASSSLAGLFPWCYGRVRTVWLPSMADPGTIFAPAATVSVIFPSCEIHGCVLVRSLFSGAVLVLKSPTITFFASFMGTGMSCVWCPGSSLVFGLAVTLGLCHRN